MHRCCRYPLWYRILRPRTAAVRRRNRNAAETWIAEVMGAGVVVVLTEFGCSPADPVVAGIVLCTRVLVVAGKTRSTGHTLCSCRDDHSVVVDVVAQLLRILVRRENGVSQNPHGSIRADGLVQLEMGHDHIRVPTELVQGEIGIGQVLHTAGRENNHLTATLPGPHVGGL